MPNERRKEFDEFEGQDRANDALANRATHSEHAMSFALPLTVLTLVGLFLRLSYVNNPIGWDEAKVLGWVWRDSVLDIVGQYHNVGNHFFLTILLKLSTEAFGSALWAVRLPAVVFGTLLIPASYYAVRIISNRSAALITAALISATPHMLFTSTNARGYILQTFFLVLLVPLTRQLVLAYRKRDIAYFCLATILSLYTLPNSIMLLPGLVLWGMWLGYTADNGIGLGTAFKRLFVGFAIAGVPTFLLYLYPILHTGIENVAMFQKVYRHPLENIFPVLGLMGVASLDEFTWNMPSLLVMALGAFLATGVLVLLVRNRNALVLFVSLVISFLAVTTVFRMIGPPRTYLFISAFMYQLIGIGIAGCLALFSARRQESLAMFCSVLIVSGLGYFAVTGEDTKKGVGYSRPRGAEQLVLELNDELLPDDFVSGLSTQFGYWMIYHGIDTKRWKSFNLKDFEKLGGKRFFILLQKDAITIESVLKQWKEVKAFKDFDVTEFRGPTLFREYPDLHVYMFEKL